jgi:uncharacterized protein with HEPN domain
MSKRTPRLIVEDMLEAIGKIELYLDKKSFQDFIDNPMAVDAVVRNLQIIGEAANRLPESILEENKSIPWHDIVGLRNRIVHDYFGIDYDIIWIITSKELSELKKSLQIIYETLKK